MCHILSRLSIGVCSKIAISICVDIFLMCYFSHFLLRYIDVLLFRQFFDYKLYSSLLLFKIYSKNHYLLYCPKAFISMCFYPEWLSIHLFCTEKSRWRFLVIFYIFHWKYWFSDYFLFHCIIFVIYIQHWHLVRTENAQRIDLEQTKPGCQQTTAGVAIFRICVTLNIL